jgi:hypothetical protein
MNRMLARVALFVFAVTMSLSAFAASKSESLTLFHDAQLNGTTLPAGEYTVKCDTNGTIAQVHVMKGRKEVASASGQIKNLSAKPEYNSVVLENGSGTPAIGEIMFHDTTTAITFDSNMANAGK